MTETAKHRADRPVSTMRTGLVLAARGDALVPYLSAAVQRRYPVAGRLNPELTPVQRMAVAAASFRPSRTRWVEQFYKSHHGYRIRTANAARQLARLPHAGPVLQVHALFEVLEAPSLLYVDCTHAQSARHWPAWNPLHGNALERWYERERRAYRDAAHVFAFSGRTRDSLLSDYGLRPDQVSVVGAGINLQTLPPLRPRQPTGPPTVLFIGNDFARKGGHTLVQAFRQVRLHLPTARLRLVGTHPGIEAEPGVEILGRVHDRVKIDALYRTSNVFCLPSFFDPLPLVLLEAMAHGLPVVTSPSCGIPEVVTDGVTGNLVPAGDPGAIAQSLLRLLNNPEQAVAWGAAGQQHVSVHHTWDHVVERMSSVIDPLLTS